MSAATEQAPIVVAFPTVNDGLVLRWYVYPVNFEAGNEIASASRNRAVFHWNQVTPELREAVEGVHRRLRDDVYRGRLGLVDNEQYAAVEALATHKTKGLFSRELLPLEPVATEE